jgi:four helix bundle protein
MDRQALEFEKLNVYPCGIEFLAIVLRLGMRMPRGNADLRDQLWRASRSIALSIAEGSGKTSRAETPP